MKLTKKITYWDVEETKIQEQWFEDEKGRWQGDYKCYYENGILNTYSQYKNDNWHGIRTYFKEDGSLDSIMYFWEGKKVSKTEFVFRNKFNK